MFKISFFDFLKRRILWVPLLIFVFSVYFVSGWSANLASSGFGKKDFTYHLLADAFQAGQIALLVKPNPELLALENPYDPKLNSPLKDFHDVSLYKGKYYVYFGPVPALTLFLPLKAFFNYRIPEYAAVAVFGLGAWLWSLLLLGAARRQYFASVGQPLIFALGLFLGLCNLTPLLAHRAMIYEVAIAAAAFYSVAAYYFIFEGLLAAGNARKIFWAIGSLMLGLSVGCRPHFALAGFALFLFPWLTYKHEKQTAGVFLREMVFLVAPFAVCVFFLGLYNYARFDSWTDFGIFYQLAGTNQLTGNAFGTDKIFKSLYAHFFSAVRFGFEFPFFKLGTALFGETICAPAFIAGCFSYNPFLWGLFVFPLLFFKLAAEQFQKYFYLFQMIFILVGTTLVLAVVISSTESNLRYQMDFISFLNLAAVFVFLFFWREKPGGRKSLGAAALILAVLACAMNLLLSFESYKPETYWARRPDVGMKIKKMFLPLQGVFFRSGLVRYGAAQMRVRFPLQSENIRQPLVTSGEFESGNFVYMVPEGENKFRFGYDYWGAGGGEGESLRLDPGSEHVLEISLGSLYPGEKILFDYLFPHLNYETVKNRVSVKVDGQTVLDLEVKSHSVAPWKNSFGRNPIGGAPSLRKMQGEILSSKRL